MRRRGFGPEYGRGSATPGPGAPTPFTTGDQQRQGLQRPRRTRATTPEAHEQRASQGRAAHHLARQRATAGRGQWRGLAGAGRGSRATGKRRAPRCRPTLGRCRCAAGARCRPCGPYPLPPAPRRADAAARWQVPRPLTCAADEAPRHAAPALHRSRTNDESAEPTAERTDGGPRVRMRAGERQAADGQLRRSRAAGAHDPRRTHDHSRHTQAAEVAHGQRRRASPSQRRAPDWPPGSHGDRPEG